MRAKDKPTINADEAREAVAWGLNESLLRPAAPKPLTTFELMRREVERRKRLTKRTGGKER